MMRGARRGCVRLQGAVIGIDDEDDSTFTITVDHKTFHFQARDVDEKEKWIDALEMAIYRHTNSLVASISEGKSLMTWSDYDRKLAETDAFLQLLIKQAERLEERMGNCSNEQVRQKYAAIKESTETMIEGIKQSIILLQIAKQNIESFMMGPASIGHLSLGDNMHSSMPELRERMHSARGTCTFIDPNLLNTPEMPEMSYSSSDDENFFDAEEFNNEFNIDRKGMKETENVNPSKPNTVIASKDDFYDELYDDVEEDELGSLDQHGSVLTHLLSQVRIGMDLTKIVLPTFILERRSLLEMYADFLAHPDLFVSIPHQKTPRERMVQTVKFYLSIFHAGRRSSVSKKPYNPILGEIFRCYYEGAEQQPPAEIAGDGPIPWARKNDVTLIAEQVSHHPPISAFYAECFNERIAIDGYVWTKSKFLGLSVGVHMIGQAVLSLLDHDEEYIITFPNAYGRSILTVPWFELGGKVTITCPKTGYTANVEFHTKPFYGGKKDQVSADVFAPGEKKSFCEVKGEWNGVMWATYNTGMNEKFFDTKGTPIMKKMVKPIDQQEDYESRRLWKDVTLRLKQKDVHLATEAKHVLEQRQREEALQRKEAGKRWETRHFHEVGEHWVYDQPLVKRVIKHMPGTSER